MSLLGQSRHFDRGPAASGLPRSTDIVRLPRHVSNVPTADLHKPPEGVRVDLIAGNVSTLHAAPLPTNVASKKSRVADSSIQLRWGGWRAAAGISVCGVS
jgi:hypothetical protein